MMLEKIRRAIQKKLKQLQIKGYHNAQETFSCGTCQEEGTRARREKDASFKEDERTCESEKAS